MATEMIPTLMNGRWWLSLPLHRAVWPQWATGWEPERLNALHANIYDGDLVFDIGAEEGDMTALFASWAGPRGGVVAFEPSAAVWPNIHAIFTSNALELEGYYVGFCDDFTGEPTFSPGEDSNGWPACAFGPVISDHTFCRPEERPDIPRIALDDYCKRTGRVPDIITMDVEGSELKVLHGAAEVLSRYRPLVFVSIHPDFMQAHYGYDDAALHAYMKSMGYSSTHLATDHEQHWVFSHPDGRPFLPF